MQMERLKVLIVDDYEDAVDTLAALVRLLGHECFVAYSTATGLRLAEREVPDLIIHDIALPRMSGYDAARFLRQMPALRQTVLVAHTAHSTEQDRRRAKEAGFDQHLAKPIDQTLLATLLKTVALRHQRRPDAD